MSNTVVGIFEYESDGQRAQNYLLSKGFADGDVDIKTASYTSDSTTTEDRDSDFGDRVGNFFKNLFDDDEEESRRYSEAGRRGTIVTVHARSLEEAEVAAAILDQYGAIDVNEDRERDAIDQPVAVRDTDYDADKTYVADNNYITDTAPLADPVPAYDAAPEYDGTPVTGDIVAPEVDELTTSLPVIEEEVRVGKREIETGGVRLRSRIVQRPVQESVRLRQEQVIVERTPVDRAATDAEFDTFREGTIEMKEYAEIPVVSKEARVVEEVSLRKTVDERDEVINETVRNTEVDVEDLTEEDKMRRSGLDL